MFYDSYHNHRGRRHAGRHGRHPGGLPPGGFWKTGSGNFRGGGFPRGRKLSAADLQIVLLALLKDKPAHGYELIRALEEKSGGFYSPSPGVIYPALTYLDEIGEAEVEVEGKRKLYRITPAGAARLAENRETADALLEALGRIGERMDRVRAAFDGEDETGREVEMHFRALRSLKRVLREKRGASPQELKRIATILYRAAKEIGEGPDEA